MSKRWYVVHAYSGYEKRVAASIMEQVELLGMQDDFGEILVPTESIVEHTLHTGPLLHSSHTHTCSHIHTRMHTHTHTPAHTGASGRRRC